MSGIKFILWLSSSKTTDNPPPTETEAPNDVPTDPTEIRALVDKYVAEGKKAIALKQWEEGVAKYADALEQMGRLVDDFDPQMAPLLLSYGKALYELAFSQQGVMGKDEGSKEADDAVRQATLEEAPAKNNNFVFSADPASDDEEDDEDEGDATPAAAAANPAAEGEASGEVDGDEPEDDYNAAWEVLDVARTIYQKLVDELKEGEGKDVRLTLADCYLALGDVSCETENFPQAVQDYSSALAIKSSLLPPSSRALASVHYQLATVLEFTPNRRSDALSHVEKAFQGFKARKAELESASSDESLSEEVKKLSAKEKENDLKDVESLLGDLEVKIEELKSAPDAGDLVSESISHLLGQPAEGSGSAGGGGSVDVSGPVNDLTSMVRKKKPKVVAGANSAVQEVKKAVGELVDGATAKAQVAQETVGQAAVVVGEKVAEVGESLQKDDEEKRKAEGNGDEERPSKKAKAE
ncbi:hypothetical protein CI109_100640 [Kwoniella shandongensis]|uniref:Uncharacterized protein n=1 Tax=Kwoniella shandongensis TaxID=1734106 RepID=A0A5M6C0R5_9TREE|nr:uncharacterized protein CI109_003438 [Kwoniella shandongensis]KAA5528150.1 hypothetical protein CI109_003438 [Kwoniella shandongensis]